MAPARGGFDTSVPPPEARVTIFLAVILAASVLGLLGAIAMLRRGSGPARLPAAAVTVPARTLRSRRRAAR